MNHNEHDEDNERDDYDDYEDDEDLDGEDISDRDADLEDVREQVAQLTDGQEVLTLNGEDGSVPEVPADAAGYGAIVAEFCWSRLKREEQDAFLAKVKKAGARNALLVLLDEVYVEGVSNPVARTDAQGNTYEIVMAEDGARVERTKSYPTDSALRKRLGNAVKEIRVARWEYFWVLTCKLK
jgi:hypothetical protein